MAPARTENLALHFQEVLTAIVRLRANRQAVSDAESFRHHMREALRAAGTEAQRSGYSLEDIKLAAFAAVALLDESILNAQNPLFADWPRKPLQEEMFGTHVAGETFFQYAQQLLARPDSHEGADLLEVYYLCLLLGYSGRYSVGGRGELQVVKDAMAAKIRRIRGAFSGLAPSWALPPDPPRATGADPWVRRLTWAAIACAVLALLMFVVFKMTLSSGISDLRAIATQSRS
ncbi:MAG TPA: DotU family type IV/VI secretion system protein [Candidatus Acidoferrales bacterium]|nr:DotU family type IV/VI secretion system protein [Candidatus Acidoferrales bacterium]